MKTKQSALAERLEYVPERPVQRRAEASKSHPLEKFLSLLILVNVLLTMGAVLLCYRLSSSVFTVEYLRRTMLETQQEIWKLNTNLEMATNEKMQELLGNANYSYSLSDIGQR